MILITGAAGKTGLAVVRALAAQEESQRVLAVRSEQVAALKALGVQEVMVGDMRDRSAVDRALDGVRVVYHIPPNVSPDEVAIGENLIGSCRSAGAEHFVYHSVLHPQIEVMPHHWYKLRVEEKLLESGLPFTILQPATYMQNILAQWKQIYEEGIYSVPYSAETRLSMVDLNDVAQAAAVILTESGHESATYELVGTNAISQTEVAGILSQQSGRPVQVAIIPLKTWMRQARASGLGEYQVEALTSMFRYYERYGFRGNTRVLSWLIRRPPTTFEAFVGRVVQERLGVGMI